MAEVPLLDNRLRRRLDTLSLVSRQIYANAASGERRSPRRGASVEFADFRAYQPGDDLRTVDWRAYGRLDRLYVKQFNSEEDLSLHLLVDASRSMSLPPSKSHLARSLAAALGYVALAEDSRAQATLLGTPKVFAPVHGRRGLPSLMRFLSATPEADRMDLAQTLTHYTARQARPGMVVVLSDFFDENHVRALRALSAKGFGGAVIHILAPEELNPKLFGDLRLRDSETRDTRDLTLTPAALRQYHTRLQNFCDNLRTETSRVGFSYLRLSSDTSTEEAVVRLAKAGLLR